MKSDSSKLSSQFGHTLPSDNDENSTPAVAASTASEKSLEDNQLFFDKTYIPPSKYDFLDFTANIQLHSWGSDLKEAFEQIAMCMYGLLTIDLNTVEMKDIKEVSVHEDDMISLLYHFLKKLLFLFYAEPFLIGRKVHITKFDPINFSLTASVFGEPFQIQKHHRKSDIKAITYSNIQVHTDSNQIFVIVDI